MLKNFQLSLLIFVPLSPVQITFLFSPPTNHFRRVFFLHFRNRLNGLDSSLFFLCAWPPSFLSLFGCCLGSLLCVASFGHKGLRDNGVV